METRIAVKEDLQRLKVIWKLCFGDEDRYIDFYFDNRDWETETAVLLIDNQIVSMMAMIPVDIAGQSACKFNASMIYAVATHPDFQKQGLADRLMEYCNHYLLAKQISLTMLVPADNDLFRYYRKRGYKEAFPVRQVELNNYDIEGMTDTLSSGCRLYPAKPFEYNEMRRSFLTGYSYIDYQDEEISFQKKESQLFGSDIYGIELKAFTDERNGAVGVNGCAAIERISEDKVIVKELLLSENYLPVALKQILKLMPAEKYIVRTPVFLGETLGGSVRAFGMLRVNQKTDLSAINEAYLGIAYD